MPAASQASKNSRPHGERTSRSTGTSASSGAAPATTAARARTAPARGGSVTTVRTAMIVGRTPHSTIPLTVCRRQKATLSSSWASALILLSSHRPRGFHRDPAVPPPPRREAGPSLAFPATGLERDRGQWRGAAPGGVRAADGAGGLVPGVPPLRVL